MKKIKVYLRSLLCIVLTSVSLCLPVGYGYLGASCAYGFVQVIVADFVLEFVETVIISLGVTYYVKEDLEMFSAAFSEYMDNVKEKTGEIKDELAESCSDLWENIKDGSMKVLDFTSAKMKNLVQTVKNFYTRYYSRNATGQTFDSSGISFGNLDCIADYLYPLFSARAASSGWMKPDELKRFLLGYQNAADSFFACCRTFDSTVDAERLVIEFFSPECKLTNVYAQYGLDSAGRKCVKLCNVSDGSDAVISCPGCRFTSKYLNKGFTQEFMKYKIGYMPLDKWTMFVNMPVYDSYNDYKIVSKIMAEYALQHPAISTGKTVELPDSKTLTGDTSFSEQVEQALKDADAVTNEDVNAIVSKLIDEYAQQNGKVQDSVDSQTGTLAGWLSKIYDQIVKIVTSVTSLPAKIADAVSVHIPSLSTVESLLKSISKSLSGTLNVAINGITDLPAQIADAVSDVIPDSITAHLDGITDIPRDIADAVAGAIVIPGSIALEGVATLPKDIADAIGGALSGALDIPDSIALDIPDVLPVEFPDTLTVDTILDLPQVLEGTLADVFAFDDAAVSAATDSLAAEWAAKFPYTKIAGIFAPLSFPDTYTYPVLKIQRPKILNNLPIPEKHLTTESGIVYVVLLNTADYAQYFKYIRNIIRAMIWVGFAYHILRGFKVYFSIG